MADDLLLLDTSVASLLHPRKAGSSLRVLYAPDLVGHPLAISLQTAAEMYLWADSNGWGEGARSALDEQIDHLIVLAPDPPLARRWAAVMDAATRAGRRLQAADAWIAATAIQYDLPLVTHDRDLLDLPVAGLRVITHLR